MSGMATRLLAVAAYRSSWRVPGRGSGRPEGEGDTVSMRVVGAGLGRTGTHSLKLALERLLGAPCYHMVEVFEHMDHVPMWHAAIRGEPVDWRPVLGGYAAIVDWPGAAVWRDLASAYPE